MGLSDNFVTNRTIPIEANELQYNVRDLSPGASYQVQAFTVFDNRESLAYTSRNFTTSKILFFLFFILLSRLIVSSIHKRHFHANKYYLENANSNQLICSMDFTRFFFSLFAR